MAVFFQPKVLWVHGEPQNLPLWHKCLKVAHICWNYREIQQLNTVTLFLQLWIQRSTCSIPGLTVDRVKKLSGLCYEVIDSGPKFQATVPIFDCQSRHLESSWTFGLAPLIYLQCFSFWPQEGSKRHQKDGERRDLKWKHTILSQSWRNIFKIFTTVNLQLYHFLVVLRLVKKTGAVLLQRPKLLVLVFSEELNVKYAWTYSSNILLNASCIQPAGWPASQATYSQRLTSGQSNSFL